MNYLDTIKNQIGHYRFERLEKEADKELSLALNTQLKKQFVDKQYYRKRILIGEDATASGKIVGRAQAAFKYYYIGLHWN